MKLTFGGGLRNRSTPAKTIELDLDTNGQVAGIEDSKFASPRGLGPVLARTPQCQECIVKQYFRYVSGRMETPADRPSINKAAADFRNSQFRFKELMVSLVRAREFAPAGGDVHAAGNH
jgi:hypothetical protein